MDLGDAKRDELMLHSKLRVFLRLVSLLPSQDGQHKALSVSGFGVRGSTSPFNSQVVEEL